MIEETDAGTWWTKWTVPAAPLILAIAIVAASIAYGFYRMEQNQAEALDAIHDAQCENQREFRSFMTDYLESQVGSPVEEIPGFDQLTPEARQFALLLGPVVEAGRQRDQASLARFIATFPIPLCE